jgi:hypothetical protein
MECLFVKTPPPTIADNIKNVVAITIDDQYYCSGWVKKGTHEIITAAHCADGSPSEQVFEVDFGDGKKHPFHEKKVGDANLFNGPDLMILYTSSDEDKKIKWPVGFDTCHFPVYYGEPLELFGGPLARSGSVFFGRVGNPSVDLSDQMDGAPTFAKHMIEWDGEMFPGNSGGPAVDVEHNCVVGSAEMSQRADHGMGQNPMGVNFFTPISDLERIET